MLNKEFIRGEVPITKEEVRAISLHKLNLMNKRKFLDIGTGTGSICIEAGKYYPSLEVVSVDKSKKALDLASQNLRKFSLKNVSLLEANLPDEIPNELLVERDFDSVFIGGASNNVEGVISWIKNIMKSEGILVANFILLESMTRSIRQLEIEGFVDIEVVQVYISRLEKLGSGNYFKPNNPIFIVSARKVD